MMKASDDPLAVAYDVAREGGDGQTGRFARRARSRRHRTGGGTRQYDAFGRTIRQTGPYAEANPFRYSTKYTDDGTSLIYYGKRYYHSAWGRFITRDPAQESGGLNLYGFTGNNGVNRIDYLGLSALVDGHDMDPYGVECERTEMEVDGGVIVTTDCNDGTAPFSEFFPRTNPGDTFGGDGGITIDTGGLPGIVVTPDTGGDSTVVEEIVRSTVDEEDLRRKGCEEALRNIQTAARSSVPLRERARSLTGYRDRLAGSFGSDTTFAVASAGAFVDIAEFGSSAFVPESAAKLFVGMIFRTNTLVQLDGAAAGERVSAFADATLGLTSVTLTYGSIEGVSTKFAGRAGPYAAIGVLGIKTYANFAPHHDQQMQRNAIMKNVNSQI